MDGLPLFWGLQKPEIKETQARRRRQPQDTPQGILLPVHGVLREETTIGAIHRHHHHAPRRELFPGQPSQREDRADDAHRRARLKVAVPTFLTGPYHSCDLGSEVGPSEGVDGSSAVARRPKWPDLGGRPFASLLRWTFDSLALRINILQSVLYT